MAAVSEITLLLEKSGRLRTREWIEELEKQWDTLIQLGRLQPEAHRNFLPRERDELENNNGAPPAGTGGKGGGGYLERARSITRASTPFRFFFLCGSAGTFSNVYCAGESRHPLHFAGHDSLSASRRIGDEREMQ